MKETKERKNMNKQNIEELKKQFDIVQYIGQEISLHKNGRGFVGLCPFHDDHNPSFCVNAETQTYKCFGCGASGDILTYIQKKGGIDFKEAVHILSEKAGMFDGSLVKEKNPVRIENLSGRVQGNLRSQAVNRLIDHYHRQLLNSPEAKDYLERRKLFSGQLIETFQIGYADGALLDHITPEHEDYPLLKAAGFIAKGKSGKPDYEYFRGYIIAPFYRPDGSIGEVYGRAIHPDRKIAHRYLPGAHSGMFNPRALKVFGEMYLCECVIDALSLWSMGFHNATCTFGKAGVTEELVAELSAHNDNPRHIKIVFDTDADDVQAERCAELFMRRSAQCSRVHIPAELKDVNNFLCTRLNDGKTIEEVKSEFLAFPQTPYNALKAKTMIENRNRNVNKIDNVNEVDSVDEALKLKKDEYGILIFGAGEREYTVKGLNFKKLCDLRVMVKLTTDECTVREQLNLLFTRDKERFSRRAKDLGGQTVSEFKVLADLESLTGYLENFQETRFIEEQEKVLAFIKKEHVMTNAEAEEARGVLSARDYLTETLLEDMERMGIKGEVTNKLLLMICAMSCKDKYPAHILIDASRGSGKSRLQSAVLNLMPEADVFRLSRSTENVLYYMEPGALSGKIVSIDEVTGAGGGNFYSFRTMMSEGRLEILYTGKDESGRFRAQTNVVDGPISVFFATTKAESIDEETRSRMLNTHSDESAEQTTAVVESIIDIDNTDKGELLRKEAERITRQHRNMQSAFLSLNVKLAHELKQFIMPFGDDVQARRNARMYGTVLRTIARSRMFRRTVHENADGSKYIDVEKGDIDMANRLLTPIFNEQRDDLKGRKKRVYNCIRQYAEVNRGNQRINEVDITEKEIRKLTGLSHTQAYEHITELVRMEYLDKVYSGARGSRARYRITEE